MRDRASKGAMWGARGGERMSERGAGSRCRASVPLQKGRRARTKSGTWCCAPQGKKETGTDGAALPNESEGEDEGGEGVADGTGERRQAGEWRKGAGKALQQGCIRGNAAGASNGRQVGGGAKALRRVSGRGAEGAGKAGKEGLLPVPPNKP